jgi:hypothetical protein
MVINEKLIETTMGVFYTDVKEIPTVEIGNMLDQHLERIQAVFGVITDLINSGDIEFSYPMEWLTGDAEQLTKTVKGLTSELFERAKNGENGGDHAQEKR